MENENMIRVLKIEGIQAEVEGLFECVYLENNCIAVVNEEGKINGMELNRRIGNDIIAGPFFICGDSEDGEFVSLTDKQAGMFTKDFNEIPVFTGKEPEAQPRMSFIGFKL